MSQTEAEGRAALRRMIEVRAAAAKSRILGEFLDDPDDDDEEHRDRVMEQGEALRSGVRHRRGVPEWSLRDQLEPDTTLEDAITGALFRP
jgi:hypothetical protein